MKLAIILLLAALSAAPLKAATLQEAMMQAYDSNPTMQKQRAALRITDEGVALAKSGERPSLDADANIGRAYNNVSGLSGSFTPRGVGLSLTQPIYRGGSIEAGINAAEKTVLAQRAQLQASEQNLFLGVAQAYLDVARDQAVLKLNRKNEDVLGKEKQAAFDRLKVGEATKTDSSQSESRLSGAVADRIQAEGKLAVSHATYMRVTGASAGELDFPKYSMQLPSTLDEVIATAQNENPLVIAARYNEDSAKEDIDVAEGSLLPQVSINASAGRDWDQTIIAPGRADTALIQAQLVVPLYRAGADYARTRAAKQTASQRRIEVREAMDQARQQAVSAWQDLMTARATITARQKQINATELALKGVREESNVGTRTVLDRLNAEAEAVQSQVDLIQAQRDEVLAMFEVKAAIGQLTAEKLNLNVDRYNPQDHYDKVRDKWFGVGPDDIEADNKTMPAPIAAPVAAPAPVATPIVAEMEPKASPVTQVTAEPLYTPIPEAAKTAITSAFKIVQPIEVASQPE